MTDIKKHLETCDRCNGTGKQFKQQSHVFFREWRLKLGLTQPEVCVSVGISDKTQLSKFEQGHIVFSVERLAELADYYQAAKKPKP